MFIAQQWRYHYERRDLERWCFFWSPDLDLKWCSLVTTNQGQWCHFSASSSGIPYLFTEKSTRHSLVISMRTSHPLRCRKGDSTVSDAHFISLHLYMLFTYISLSTFPHNHMWLVAVTKAKVDEQRKRHNKGCVSYLIIHFHLLIWERSLLDLWRDQQPLGTLSRWVAESLGLGVVWIIGSLLLPF